MDVSIIIINYNTKQMTSECIDSVIEHTKNVEYEIILVDNASRDGSKELFEKDSRVRYIYSEKNAGFGAGNNLGVKYAVGKYLFLLNSDTLLKNNAIKIFYDYAESHNPYCVHGSWLLDKDGNPNGSQYPFPRMTYGAFVKSFFIKPIKEDRTKMMHVDAVVGADMFLPKTLFDKVNGFDEKIFMYDEETEMQYRFKKMGVDRIVIPGPEIVHFGGASSVGNKALKINSWSHYYIIKKHMPWYTYYGARLYYALNYCFRWMMHPSDSSWLKHAFIRVKC